MGFGLELPLVPATAALLPSDPDQASVERDDLRTDLAFLDASPSAGSPRPSAPSTKTSSRHIAMGIVQQ
jgi:hypothetical protein